jgi:hypothetical protein
MIVMFDSFIDWFYPSLVSVHIYDRFGRSLYVTRLVRADETNELHLPMSHVSDLFKYRYMSNSMVGYMVNYPSDLSGKMANFVSIFSWLSITMKCGKHFFLGCQSEIPRNGGDIASRCHLHGLRGRNSCSNIGKRRWGHSKFHDVFREKNSREVPEMTV